MTKTPVEKDVPQMRSIRGANIFDKIPKVIPGDIVLIYGIRIGKFNPDLECKDAWRQIGLCTILGIQHVHKFNWILHFQTDDRKTHSKDVSCIHMIKIEGCPPIPLYLPRKREWFLASTVAAFMLVTMIASFMLVTMIASRGLQRGRV